MNPFRALALIVGAFLFPMIPSHGSAEPSPVPPGKHARNYLSSLDNSFQPYNLFVPSAAGEGEALPLVVVLHGKGATWQSWFHATTVTDWAEAEGYYVAAPHGRGDWFYRGPGERDVLDVMEEVKSLLPVDQSRVYLLGHSMGGYGAWHLAAAYPDKFAAVVPMSTWAPLHALENLLHSQPLLIHGLDDDVVPAAWSDEAVARLEALEIPHRYVSLPGRGHESSMISDSLVLIGEWIRGKSIPPSPRRVSLRFHTPTHGTAWWLTGLELEVPGNLAALDGEVDEEAEAVRIETRNLLRFAIHRSLPGLPDEAYTIHLDGDVLTPPEGIEPWIYFEREDTGWTVSALTALPSPAMPNYGVTSHVPEDIAAALARLIHSRMQADVALLPRAFAATEVLQPYWTLDVILNLYLHPDDRLFTAEINGAEFASLMERREEWFPGWWEELVAYPALEGVPEEGPMTVAFPAVLVERLGLEAEASPVTIKRAALEHIASGQLLGH